MSNIDNIFFDISKLKVDFNKKINLNDLFLEVLIFLDRIRFYNVLYLFNFFLMQFC